MTDKRGDLVNYPFQLRPNLFIHLYLPVSMTKADVTRITAFLNTLVVK